MVNKSFLVKFKIQINKSIKVNTNMKKRINIVLFNILKIFIVQNFYVASTHSIFLLCHAIPNSQ